MIADAILDLVFATVQGFVDLIPTTSVNFQSGFAGASAYTGYVGQVADVTALAAVMGTIAAAETAALAYRFLLFVWRLTPFSG